MKKKRNVLAAILSLCMLCACSGQPSQSQSVSNTSSASQPSQPSQPSGSVASSASVSQDAGSAGTGGPYTLPLTDKPITLTCFIAMDSKAGLTLTNLSENLGLQDYEKITGIHVEYNHPSSATSTSQALNIMIASNDLDDIIYNINSVSGGLDSIVKSGQILRLNEMIEEYGYYLNQTFQEYPEFKAQVMTYEGNIANYPSARLADTTHYFESLIIRKDWLDKLGLEVPTDLESWYTVLTAFKEKDPNGNGQQDELPFISNSTEEMGILRLGCFYGLNATWFRWEATGIEDGKVVFAPFKPEFKDYLTTMNQWYTEGLIDPEYLSTDAKGFSAKVLNDQGGAFYGKMNGGIATFMSSSKTEGFEVSPVPYPITADGKSYDLYSQDISDAGGAAISASCKYPVEALRWLDYRYSPEGQIHSSFGIEGITYNMVDGAPQYSDMIVNNTEGWSLTNAIAHYTTGGIAPRLVNDEFYWNAVMLYPQQRLVYPTVSASTDERKMHALKYSQEDQAKLDSLLNDLGTYYTENVHAFVMGTKPLSEYDSFVETLKSMGAEEVISLKQKAYEQYLASMK
ncbi:MAG: extracellular solute-binding protein [Oscillospiraceae bacterium]|nr:extracellular solute-binding protein [Oscillospiraceae bacterium]